MSGLLTTGGIGMVNGQLMYLRPGNLFKDFIIEHSKSDLKSGRPPRGGRG